MRFMKKAIFLLICVMVVAVVSITVFAANGETNLSYDITDTQVEIDGEITLTLSIGDMTASAFKGGFYFDNTKLEVSKITWSSITCYSEEEEDDVDTAPMSKTTKKKANTDGSALGVYLFNMGTDSECYECTFVTVTFKAIANGEATITLREETTGTDAFKSDSVETITITIGSSAPACEHEYKYDCDKVCAKCGEETRPEAEHQYTYACDAHCAICHELTNEGAEHNIIHVEAVDATCTKNGNIEYWYCDICGSAWADENLTQVTNLKAVILPAGHSFLNGIRGTQLSVGDCVTPATYATKCDRCDVEDKTKVITGETNPANHAGEKFCVDTPKNMSQHLVYCNKCGELWDSQNPYAPHEADEEGYCECGLFAVVQDFNGGQISTKPPYPEMTEEAWTHMVESQLGGFDATSMSRFTHGLSILMKDENIAMMNLMFVKEGYKLVGLAYDEEGTQRYNGEDIKKPTTLYYVWEPLHTHAHDHYDITETTHQSICSCGETIDKAEEHDYTTGTSAHTCACEAVEKFTLTLSYINSKGDHDKKTIQVPFGTKLSELAEVLALPETLIVDNTAGANLEQITAFIGTFKLDSWAAGTTGDMIGMWKDEFQNLTMPAMDYCLTAEYYFTGWYNSCGDGWEYWIENYPQKGWIQVDGAWYYLKPSTNIWGLDIFIRVEGLTRVPYPTAPINGILYAPNAEDLAYAANKGREFIDATEAWFVFGEDGKFQFDMTEIMDGKYVENGMIAWHPGFVTVGGELYYFVGDKENGGNIWANGDVIVSRLNGAAGFVNLGTYNFVDGRLNKLNGIEPGANGKLYYYINGWRQVKLGLARLGEGKYIYVRSNGELAVGEYYIPANGLGVVSTLYTFDANGYMVNPKYTNVNGIVDGYYYVNGKIDYGAGLINIDGDIYYVRSSGKVATGEYYITNTNGMPGFQKGMKLTFGADGKLLTKTTDFGSVINGYYYVGGKIAYGAGVVKMEDENGVFYIYVKSNGQLATGKYWPTTLNGELAAGEYDWGTDGKYYPGN